LLNDKDSGFIPQLVGTFSVDRCGLLASGQMAEQLMNGFSLSSDL